jgi:hypothetical protein
MSFCVLSATNPHLKAYSDLRVCHTIHVVLMDIGTSVIRLDICEPHWRDSEFQTNEGAGKYQNNGNKNANAVVCYIIFSRARRSH